MKKSPFAQLKPFYYVRDLAATRKFYEEILELPMVLDQGHCLVFRVVSDAFVGFCQREAPQKKEGIILTFVVNEVDDWYQKLQSEGVHLEGEPFDNDTYGIYHFFFRDPDGYLLEIQRFHQTLE